MNTTTEQQQITLYYREGSSDKVYQVAIEAQGTGFVVNFAYGRRGSTLQTGTKTSSPVNSEAAKAIFEKLVREKKAKGYTEGESGTPYQHTANEQRVSGIQCQLLNPIEEEEVNRLLQDPHWCMQEKKDGKRMLLRKQEGQVTAINRKALTIGLPASIVNSARDIPQTFILDGECVGEVYYAFDLLALDEDALLTRPYQERLAALTELLEDCNHPHIELIETAFETEEKRQFLQTFRQDKKEGVVFKRLDAPYTPGRPSSGGSQLKHKFYATLSALVMNVNGQRSVAVGLWTGKDWQRAGNVTIPANQEIPKIGAILELRYLYAYRESGCLYQPICLGQRQDLTPHDCTVGQLKFKAEEEEES